MEIVEKYNVSRETIRDLEEFQKMVLDWNKKFNLISKTSENHIWNRHIVDSLQLVKFIKKEDTILYDLGSGAGFPGVVIAIYAKYFYPSLKVFLVESVRKKASFLNEIKKNLDLNIEIINDRVENLKKQKIDIISSRAMASLDKLLEYSFNLSNGKTKMLFLKGLNWQKEVEQAQNKWNFSFEAIQSSTSLEGRILVIENLRRKPNG